MARLVLGERMKRRRRPESVVACEAMIGLGLGDEIGGGQFWGVGIGMKRGWGGVA